jgi:hypothetical protein
MFVQFGLATHIIIMIVMIINATGNFISLNIHWRKQIVPVFLELANCFFFRARKSACEAVEFVIVVSAGEFEDDRD